ncbi:hypothetical protein VitviT2T_026628 [Vitis vinifera]|uniref:Uncharacterized protein n=1 Tax=Vitis vinifera TaxID=29760 RepID=A0ABY9DPA0_VITVI|nr:hypothetical protein VitviT2T_026628 [Vitis vinifera]
MVLRSLQPRITRHVVGVPFTDFSSLVSALYDVEDSILRGLWTDSSPSDVKEKKPFGGQRSLDVSAINSSSQRPLGVICMSLSQALRKLTEAGLLTALAPRPPPQPIPPQFRMDLYVHTIKGLDMRPIDAPL